MRRGFVLYFLLTTTIAFGQKYFANVRTINLDEGLSHYKALSFCAEENGLWIGTEDGLNFFDGYHWSYWTKDNGQLSNKPINYIHKDQKNRLWLFNTQRVNRKDKVLAINILSNQRDSIYTFSTLFATKSPFHLDDLQHFFVDQDHNNLYFFTTDYLWRLTESDTFARVEIPEKFKPKHIFSDGTFIGEIDNGLVLVSKEGKLLYNFNCGLNEEYYFIAGVRENFWLHQYAGKRWSFTQKEDGTYTSQRFFHGETDFGRVQLLHYDKERKGMWVTGGADIFLLDHQNEILYRGDRLASRVGVIDHRGNLVVGRNGIAIIQLRQQKFERYLYSKESDPSYEHFYRCRGIFENGDQLFVNTYKGIQIIDLKSGKQNGHALGDDVNFSFLKDHNGYLWAAKRGLIQLDKTGTKVLNKYSSELINSTIWSTFEDLNHRIWIGHEGISYFEDGLIHAFKKYNGFNKLKEAQVLFFYKDKNGVIWLGGDNGLYQLDPQQGIVAVYGKQQEGARYMPANRFQHIYQDIDGIFWIATEDAGLLRWNRTTGDIQQFDKRHGLLSSNVYAVYEDDFGYLWMSTINGLARLNKKTKAIEKYTEEDGINENEFNRVSHFQAADGKIYFGGQNGVTAFYPETFVTNQGTDHLPDFKVKYTTSVIDRKVYRDTILDQSEINLQNLSPSTATINLELECSDLFWTDKVKLHYILQKLDDLQRPVSTSKENIISDNQIELFGLTPGEYNLEIQAIHANGKKLGKTLNIPISIRIPFFQTAGFWIGIGVFLFLGTWGFVKLRTAQLRQRQIQLQVMVEERTREILNNQKTIKNQAEQIEEMKDQLQRRDELWLEQFQSIIKDRLADPDLYLPDIIDEMDVSRSVFYQKVKTLTQMTPNQYIQELRLTKAKGILDEGNVKTVKEVAFSIGMRRPAYFSKLFRERFGILPSSYFRNQPN